ISLDEAGESSCSNEATMYLRAPAPKNVAVRLNNDKTDTISLQWMLVPKVEGYIIKRATGSPNSAYFSIGILYDSSATNFDDSSFKFGVTYYYTVTSIDKAGDADESPAVSICPRSYAPTNIVIIYEQTNNLVALQWKPVVNGNGYIVKRAAGSLNDTFFIIDKINDPAITTSKDISFVFGTKYYYVVASFDELGESNQSDSVSVVCPRAPAPADPTCSYTENADNCIVLQWKPVLNSKGYFVKRAHITNSSGVTGR
ncbi:unnamed protein product, partial [Rotaria sp. Silwood1]